jgi:hypothetical protein
MNNKILYGVIGVAVIAIIVLFVATRNTAGPEEQKTNLPDGFDDITFTIDSTTVDFENGEGTIDGRKITFFGDEAEGDITEDGMADIASILKEEGATSSTYYLVAAIQTEDGYKGTNGALLGVDRQGLALRSALGGVVVQYERPSVGGAATSTGTSTAVRLAERFFVVIDGKLDSIPLPE